MAKLSVFFGIVVNELPFAFYSLLASTLLALAQGDLSSSALAGSWRHSPADGLLSSPRRSREIRGRAANCFTARAPTPTTNCGRDGPAVSSSTRASR
jgi:hypothetical protein